MDAKFGMLTPVTAIGWTVFVPAFRRLAWVCIMCTFCRPTTPSTELDRCAGTIASVTFAYARRPLTLYSCRSALNAVRMAWALPVALTSRLFGATSMLVKPCARR